MAHEVKDDAGRTWTLSVTVSGLRRVRELAGINLADLLFVEETRLRFRTDLALAADVAWAMVQPEAAAAKVTRDQFEAAWTGESLFAVRDACLEALLDFFPKAGRTILPATMETTGPTPPPIPSQVSDASNGAGRSPVG